jgi:Skp family chaperone for outer membrane proteins
MTKKLILLFALACNLCIGNLKAQSGIPNAYVDINVVLQAMPGYKDSIKKLDEIRAMYQNQYNFLLVDLQQKIKTYESKKDSLSPYVSNLKLQEIRQGQANLDTFQKVANEALKMQQDKVLSGFLTEIRNVVAQIGNLRHLGTVWDASMLKNAIWTDPKSDITQEVIKTIQLKHNPVSPPADNNKKGAKTKK